jgi:hypothetical protein
MPEKVQELLGDSPKSGLRFTCIVQDESKGFMGKNPFVVYLDNRDHIRG